MGAVTLTPDGSHRTQNFLVRQLTQLANAIRAHCGQFGLVVPKGVPNMGRLVAEAETADLPIEARMPLKLLVGQFNDTKARRNTAIQTPNTWPHPTSCQSSPNPSSCGSHP